MAKFSLYLSLVAGLLLSLGCRIDKFDPEQEILKKDTYEYHGLINQATAKGLCSFEDLRTGGGYINMSCEITSGAYTYNFTSEMNGVNNGYGEMVENPTGDRMRVEIIWDRLANDFPPDGFQMRVNPFGGGGASTYLFEKVSK